jgi:protoporphyrinogen/coproporphyrinogen III oxidase
MAEKTRVLVIGGGVGGLSTAFYLEQAAKRQGRSVQITVAERSHRWGGVTESSQQDGCLLEHGPDSIIRIKPGGKQLIDDLGLTNLIQDTNPACRTALIARGPRLLPVPDGLYLMAPSRFLPFALSPIISWWGKLRMGLDLILPRRNPDLGEESLADFVRRRLGHEALERLAQPMISGIYTADPEELCLDLAMPQFAQMERDHRSLILAMRANRKKQAQAHAEQEQASGPRYGLFLSLEGGLQTLVDRLVASLSDQELLLHTAVSAIKRDEGKEGVYRVQLGDELTKRFDAVFCCTPAWAAADMFRDLDPTLATELDGVQYGSVATVNLAFERHQLAHLPSAAGFVVPAVERRNVIACTFSSQKYLDRVPEDRVLLRAFVGGALQPWQLQASDDEMTQRVLLDLDKWLGITGKPVFTTVRRWERSMAQPTLGLAARMQRVQEHLARLGNCYLVGSGFDGVGIPDVASQAKRVAEQFLGTVNLEAGCAEGL